MFKKLFIMCLIVITINTTAQVIKQGGGNQPMQDDTYYNPYGGGRGQRPREEKSFEFRKRSLIQINLAQFVFTNVALSYEIFSKDGKSSVKIPFTFGIGGEPDTAAYQVHNEGRFLAAKNRIFETGLHYNYYFFGQRRVSPFMGAGFNVGAFNYWEYKYNYNSTSYYYTPTITKNIGTNVAGALFMGVLFNPSETVTFGLKAGIGFRRYGTDFKEYTYPYGLFEVNLGFKF